MFLSRKDGLIADTRVTSSDKLASCHRLPQLALCPALKAVLAFSDDRVYSSFQLSIKDATVHSITTGGGLHEPVSSFTYIRLLAFLPETATYKGCPLHVIVHATYDTYAVLLVRTGVRTRYVLQASIQECI